jgi:hypothetical protein
VSNFRHPVSRRTEVPMDTQQRIEKLEREVEMLRSEIEGTLLAIRESLPDKPASASARWQKKAWVLALINVLMAVALFANIYLFLPGNLPFSIDASLLFWLRAFWVALAFIWLLLQMYPLALLLEEEDQQRQGVVWHSATAFVRARPGLIVVLTLVVLIVGIVNTVLPVAWIIVALSLLVAVGSLAVRDMLELFREHLRPHKAG